MSKVNYPIPTIFKVGEKNIPCNRDCPSCPAWKTPECPFFKSKEIKE